MSTLAEQVVTQLKTDMDNVYDAGYQKGKSEGGGEDYLRLVSSFNIKGLGVFDTEEVVLNLDKLTSFDRCIYVDWGTEGYPNTKVRRLTLNCKLPIINARQAFFHPNVSSGTPDTKVERITLNADFSKCINMLNLISNFSALTVIDGTPLDFSSSTNNGNILDNCTNVEEIRIVPNSIKVNTSVVSAKNLSSESVQSLIDALADLTGQTTQTITFHADVKNELSEEQRAIITSKNWTLA